VSSITVDLDIQAGNLEGTPELPMYLPYLRWGVHQIPSALPWNALSDSTLHLLSPSSKRVVKGPELRQVESVEDGARGPEPAPPFSLPPAASSWASSLPPADIPEK